MDVFVFPDSGVKTSSGEQIAYQPPYEADFRLNTAGTLKQWKEHVAAPCAGNSRLVFGVSLSFGALLIEPTGMESGGFNLRGPTSLGKSTAQFVAGSVCGGGTRTGYVESWRSTKNGLELMAETHNDLPLILDELAQLDPHEACDAGYVLGNGQGKTRMTRTMGLGRTSQWRTMILSSGEISLAEHVEGTGRRVSGGQEVRIIDLPADAGAGLGLFEDINGASSPDVFARQIKEAALTYYGHPLRAFVKRFDRSSHVDQVLQNMKSFQEEYLPAGATGEVYRAIRRFALVAAAGELATSFHITGWREGEATWAAARCFADWLSHRGTAGSSDEEAAVRQVEGFIQLHSASRFHRHFDDDDRVIPNQAGYIRQDRNGRTEYLFSPEVFRKEVCKGFDPAMVLNALSRRGMLLRQKGRHLTVKRKVMPKQADCRFYAVVLPDEPPQDSGDLDETA